MQDIEEIYRQYSKVVYKYIFCLTQNEELSKEIVQETFLVAVKNIKQFRGKSKITTWLCQIAKYIWYQSNRKKSSIQSLNYTLLSLIGITNNLFVRVIST